MTSVMQRRGHTSTVNIAASGNTSTEYVQIERDAGLSVQVPSAWTAADIGFLGSDSETGTYVDICDSSGSRVKITGIATSEAKWYDVPEAVAKHLYIKLQSIDTSDETDEAQAAARALVVLRKS